MQNNSLSEFSVVLLFIIGSFLFVLIGTLSALLISPKRPNPEKETIYECGEDTVSSAWGLFSVKYYIIALLFLLFEVEILFLFPWSTVFADSDLLNQSNNSWGYFAIIEVFVFVFILILGLVYAWKNGLLDWTKSKNDIVSGSKSFNHTKYASLYKSSKKS